MAQPATSYLKTNWIEMPDAFFEPLRFGDLQVNQKFIFLPSPGDNIRKLGFRVPYRIYTKTQHLGVVATALGMPFGEARDSQGNSYIFVHSMLVIALAE